MSFLRATVYDNLSEKKEEEEKRNTLVFELSVGYLSWSPSPTYCMWLSTSIWNDQDPSKINDWPLENSLASYKGLSALGSVMGWASGESRDSKSSFFIKASLIKKNKKKKCSPDISQKHRSSCSLILKLSVLSLRWNLLVVLLGGVEIGRLFFLWGGALPHWIAPGWDHRYVERRAVCFLSHHPCTPVSDHPPIVLKQQLLSYLPPSLPLDTM